MGEARSSVAASRLKNLATATDRDHRVAQVARQLTGLEVGAHPFDYTGIGMARISRTEHVVMGLIFVPLGIAVNGLLFWGFRDILFPRGPIALAFDALLMVLWVFFFRRSRRQLA